MSKIIIEQIVLQKVIDYLTTKPFNEVNPLIVQIQQNSQEYADKPLMDTPPSANVKGTK